MMVVNVNWEEQNMVKKITNEPMKMRTGMVWI